MSPHGSVCEVAEAFMRAVNGGHRELRAALLGRLRRQHRTTQALLFRLMVGVLRAIGSDAEWGTDLPNEAATRYCRAPAGTREPILRDGFAA